MKAYNLNELPEKSHCKLCGKSKPIQEIVVVFIKREGYYKVRPRCKECHNKAERGHRRAYKRAYLQRWRKRNEDLTRSYWNNETTREYNRIKGGKYFEKNHEALLIQGRLRRHGHSVSISEAQELLKKFGRCYPTRFGLSRAGVAECERIRSAMRRQGKQAISAFEIRMMVYEDALENRRLIINPRKQPVPYQAAAEKLRNYQRSLNQKGTNEERKADSL